MDETARELADALERALDYMTGMLIAINMLKGETGLLKAEDTPEMVQLRAILKRVRRED